MLKLPAADAILAIDLGNTRMGVAVSDSDGIHDVHRAAAADAAACADALRQSWAGSGNSRQRVVVLGSVNPPQVDAVQALAAEVTGARVFRLRDDLPLPLALDLDRPEEVGVDRVCAAAAAFDRLQKPVAVASFGSAVTIDCVNAYGVFVGGTILPGFEMCLRALHEHTAQLPLVPLAPHEGTFGRSTRAAILNGVTFGLAGALREIVERYATELGEWPELVITGGNAPIIRELVDFVDACVPDLALIGIAMAYRKAAAP